MTTFVRVEQRPKWLFNQNAQCVMKVNDMGHTVRISTDKYSCIIEAIDMFEKYEETTVPQQKAS